MNAMKTRWCWRKDPSSLRYAGTSSFGIPGLVGPGAGGISGVAGVVPASLRLRRDKLRISGCAMNSLRDARQPRYSGDRK